MRFLDKRITRSLGKSQAIVRKTAVIEKGEPIFVKGDCYVGHDPVRILKLGRLVIGQGKMVRPERFELPTCCSGGNRSIQLSYGRARMFTVYMGKGNGFNDTLTA